VKIRYKQTALGFLWAIIQPLFMMIIFTLFFGGFAKIPSDGVPYPLFSFAALLPWTLFSEGLTRSTTSMVSNAGIMMKVYFPRLGVGDTIYAKWAKINFFILSEIPY
jgi:lipopolysaccharide transport system permease protein